MHVRLVSLTLLLALALIACSTTTPTPAPSPIALAPTITAVASPAATMTPQLVITLITPTPFSTSLPASDTATAVVTPPSTAPGAQTTPASDLGNTTADAALVAILQSCWHVSDPGLLNGNDPAQRDAFNCARSQLLSLAQSYPTYGMVHRILAWGYYYKDNSLSSAIAEYRTAATVYSQVGDKSGESEARMRLGLLLVLSNRSSACGELALAGNLDPSNDRAIQYYNAYGCASSTQTSGGQAVPPPVLQANLDEVRGKVLFKSNRDGVESVYVMNPDGSDPKRVSSSLYPAAAKWEAFSPDHSQVAVVRYAGFTRKFGYNNDIWITDPGGGSGRPLANPANDYDPVWSPRGLFDGQTWIAFVSNRGDQQHGLIQGEELWLMHPDGTGSGRLTCYAALSKHPSWSPDASKLVFDSNFQTGSERRQIYSIDLATLQSAGDKCDVGKTFKNLSNDSYDDYQPIWVK
jgi:WD40-like Beta Propeller Repeat